MISLSISLSREFELIQTQLKLSRVKIKNVESVPSAGIRKVSISLKHSALFLTAVKPRHCLLWQWPASRICCCSDITQELIITNVLYCVLTSILFLWHKQARFCLHYAQKALELFHCVHCRAAVQKQCGSLALISLFSTTPCLWMKMITG